MNPVKSNGRYRGVIQHLMLVALLSLISALFVYQDVLWRWDNLLYDAQLSFWSRAVSDDIVIIAIDDESLDELGRWPWPRSLHAELINRLELESPRVIGLDIIFNEPDGSNPESDELLAEAMQASGKVVLPLFKSQQSTNSFPIEALPLPLFTSQAAALGHVHIDIGKDGIARKVYLREGIGEPQWPHYSLALLSITEDAVKLMPEQIMGDTDRVEQYSSMRWAREFPFLIPYAGPPGHFKHIGYAQVLAGLYPKDLFRDRIVLIGTTAEGMGDALPTPLSGKGGTMPGVEIIANVVDSVLNNLRIIEVTTPWLIAITAILVAFPLFIYPLMNPASTLLVLFGVVVSTVVTIGLLLWLFGVWLPVSTILLFQFISYPLWSWRRLELAMRHINSELNELAARHKALSLHHDRNIEDEISFLKLFIPVKGWVILDDEGVQLLKVGTAPVCNLGTLMSEGWSVDGFRYWAPIEYKNRRCRLGLSLGTGAMITKHESRLLNSLIAMPIEHDDDINSVYAEDVLETRIHQVQAAGTEYEELRRIIDDSLSGMADGVLICSGRGQVLLSNRRAGWYLFGDDNARINGKSLIHILEHVDIVDGGSWSALLQTVLFEKERKLANARHRSGRDLMVELSPMRIIGDAFDGFVVNFSDISLLKASERKRNEVLDFLSHDLRAPLSSMLALIELSKNKKSLGEMQAMLDVMEKNTHKTLHLAEQFLQLSRANTSENIKFYDIDFNSVALNAIDQIWALSNKMKVTIHHEFEFDECWTHADADLLERAILNLLSNAIKHSGAGCSVNVNVTQRDNEIRCCVIDQGSGIAVEELPHLFEMFRRTRDEGVERKQGIGLGLAFVDAVAKRHSGHVEVESELGKGSSFCLIIPKVDPIQNTG